ncbi:MAG: hypothetical protein IID44_26865 [Planctomycetes bacterium]|nr:hypothetical protein [Planctomycetota bacterium]
MSQSYTVKPTHKPIKDYYAALATFREHHVDHEQAVRAAFQNLLTATGKKHGWTLIAEERIKVKGKTVIPDGTFRDQYEMHRGHWEAKDTDDDLEAEIKKKIAAGYPLGNIIFEDTRLGHLFQNGKQAMRADLTDPQQFCDLLNVGCHCWLVQQCPWD